MTLMFLFRKCIEAINNACINGSKSFVKSQDDLNTFSKSSDSGRVVGYQTRVVGYQTSAGGKYI